ncbi:MAG TPA: hypothetical protein VG318_04320 [Actinomycetota bacterium]|nr:hypothetical protein [Actinomycetota bacterium]
MRPLFLKDHPHYTWAGREVVVEFDERPHLLSRIEVGGGYFPQMGREAFMRIVVDEKTTVPAWFAEPADDTRSLRGYFATDLPASGVLEFGYGADLMGRLELGEGDRRIETLDRTRLQQDLVVPDTDQVLRRFRGDRRPG